MSLKWKVLLLSSLILIAIVVSFTGITYRSLMNDFENQRDVQHQRYALEVKGLIEQISNNLHQLAHLIPFLEGMSSALLSGSGAKINQVFDTDWAPLQLNNDIELIRFFGPDGKLYIGKGDAGWEGDPLNAGQNLNVLWGKLLRIDVDTTDDAAYAIPKDNPFAKADKPQLMSLFGINEQGFALNKIGSRPEIWAYGLRNPYMFHFDQKSGDLFIADVGQNHWEEIDYQPAASKGGENYGWKFNQGSYCHPALSDDQKCPIVGVSAGGGIPARPAVRRRAQGQRGYRLLGSQGLGVANYGGMNKTYLVGDWCSGRLFGVAWDGSAKSGRCRSSCRPSLQFTAGNVDADGFVLATNCYCFYTDDKGPNANPVGALWRVMPADKVTAGHGGREDKRN